MRSWLNLRQYPGIYLEELRKTTINFSRSPGGDLNPGSPEYEAVVLTTRPPSSVLENIASGSISFTYC
jgi:hypothetical protein